MDSGLHLGAPIVGRRIADDVVDRLVTAMALGQYVTGQQLPTERELSAMLGVSRTSVREALKELTETGYLVVRRGRNGGYFVLANWGPTSAEHVRREFTARWSEFEHVFDARRMVEQLIARTAAERRTESDMGPIRAALRAYLDAPDRDASRRADSALHRAVAQATHNPIFVNLSVDLRTRVTRNLGAEPYTEEVRRIAIGQHQELVAAIGEGRADDAAAIAEQHFALSERLMRELVARAEADDGEAGGMNRQIGFIMRRVLLTIPTLFVMSVIVFLILRLVPGDPVRTMLGFRATDENVAELRHQLGLDQSLFNQYAGWIVALLHGDLGKDIVSHAPLSELLAQRLPVTFELSGLAMLIAVAAGVPLGVKAAMGGKWIGRLTDGFVVFGISVPDFWLGIILVLIFAATLEWLPPSGYMPFSRDPLLNLRYMALPVLTLAVGEAAYILRTTRGAVTAVMGRPFVTFLRAKGISNRRIVFGHALRNAGPSIATVIGLQVGVLLGGAIIIETMFALPGVGRLVVTGINQRNYPTVQIGVLAIATIFIVVSLITDLIVGWLDPRVMDGETT